MQIKADAEQNFLIIMLNNVQDPNASSPSQSNLNFGPWLTELGGSGRNLSKLQIVGGTEQNAAGEGGGEEGDESSNDEVTSRLLISQGN